MVTKGGKNIDGSLNFDTRIDTDGIESGMDDIHDIAERLSRSMKDLSQSMDDAFNGKASKAENLTNKITLTEDKIKQLASEMDTLSNTEYHSKEFDTMKNKIEQTSHAVDVLYDKRAELEQSIRSGVQDIGLPYSEESLQKLVEENKEWMKLSSSITEAETNLEGYEAKLRQLGATDSQVDVKDSDKYKKKQMQLDALLLRYQNYRAELNRVNNSENKNSFETKKAEKSVKDKTNTINKADKTAKNYNRTLSMLGKSLMFSIVFRAFNTAMNGIKEGMQNLAKYSTETNKTLSAFSTASLQLKNSLATAFSPILTAIAPALITLINLLSNAITVMGQFFAVLFNGATTFTRAKQAQVDYAKSLKETAKQASKTLSPIDQLNNISSSGSSSASGVPKVEDMFEEVKIDNKFIDTVNNFKEMLSTLFEPIKTSWDTHGDGVIKSAKEAFNSVSELLKSIGTSFSTVWTNGTGVETVDNILITFTNINETIKNIAENFKKAWELDDTGTKILQNIFDILNNILKGINKASAATKKWSSKLDFSPILKSFESLTKALEPLTGNIADALVWLWENVMLPFAGWVITDVAPLFFEGLAAAIGILNEVVEALKPLAQWLWENFLYPLAEWTGGIIVSVLETMVGKLIDFSNWCQTHQETIQLLTVTVLGFIAAWEITKLLAFIETSGGLVAMLGKVATSLHAVTVAKLADKLETIALTAMYAKDFVVSIANGTAALVKQAAQWTIGTGLKIADKIATIALTVATVAYNVAVGLATAATTALNTAIAILTSPVTLVIAAIGALIAIVVLLIKNWDTVKEVAAKCWEAIKTAWNKAGTWFNDTIVKPIAKFFTGLWDGLKEGAKTVLDNIKTSFKTVFEALVDIVKKPVNAIIDVLNGMINGVVSGINSVIRAINSINFTLPDWVPGLGGKGIGFNVKEFNAPKIPKLATGTVVPSNYGEFLAILGDNKRETEVVSPLSTIKQALRETFSELGGMGNNGPTHVHIHLNGKEIHEEVVRVENEQYGNTQIPSFEFAR